MSMANAMSAVGTKCPKASWQIYELVRPFKRNPSRRGSVAVKARMGATHFLMKTLPRVAAGGGLSEPLIAAIRA
jgi:hypothetical protein